MLCNMYAYFSGNTNMKSEKNVAIYSYSCYNMTVINV